MIKKYSFSFLVLFNCAYFNLFYNANKYFQEGLKSTNIAEAQTKFQKAKEKSNLLLIKYPHSKWEGDALFIIGVSNYYLKEYRKALEQFQFFLSYFPNHKKKADVLYFQALTYLELKEYHKTMEILRSLTNLSPKYQPLAKYWIALIFYFQKDYQNFIDSMLYFVNQFKKHPLRKEALLKIAEVYKEQGKLKEAKDFYYQLKEIEPDEREQIKILLKMVDCLSASDKNKDTLHAYLKKLEGYMDKYSDLNNQINLAIGKIYLELENDKKAFNYLQKVKGREAQLAYYLIGENWEEKGNFDSALVYYDSSYQKDPSSELASIISWKKTLMAELLNMEKDTADLGYYHFKLGEVYLLSLNNPSLAVKEYEKVYQNYPKSKYALKAKFASAYLYYTEVDRKKGENLFYEIIYEVPDSEYAQKAKEILNL
uniref:Tetratricopeptide repeat protein n=1 Tax=candidate division WOR-3 bacterium TaxID=2052148 RepID=A0A7V4E3B2_UNCW3